MTDDAKLQLINELFEWNKWSSFAATNINDLETEGYTHSEAKAYTKGCFDYSEQLKMKLKLIKEQLVKQ